eukprot:2182081-Rhodomonas_salina.1
MSVRLKPARSLSVAFSSSSSALTRSSSSRSACTRYPRSPSPLSPGFLARAPQSWWHVDSSQLIGLRISGGWIESHQWRHQAGAGRLQEKKLAGRREGTMIGDDLRLGGGSGTDLRIGEGRRCAVWPARSRIGAGGGGAQRAWMSSAGSEGGGAKGGSNGGEGGGGGGKEGGGGGKEGGEVEGGRQAKTIQKAIGQVPCLPSQPPHHVRG